MPFPCHHLGVPETLKLLSTSKQGLTEGEAASRLQKYGKNEIQKRKSATVLDVFFRQFRSLIILILFFAAVASLLLGDDLEAGIIMVLVLLNACIGTFHEYRAERALEALKKFQPLQVSVIRGGKETLLYSSEIVPGDILSLQAGDKVPADCRIIEEARLRVDESILTGESSPVSKQEGKVPQKAILAERTSMLYSSTLVVSGRALAAVCSTGKDTEIGGVYSRVSEEREPFPIQVKLNQFSRQLGIMTIAGVVALSLLAVSLLSFSPQEILKIAVAQAVSFIPEGLPIVVTIALALSVLEMAKKKALTRKLPAIETIGVVSVICTDKTGTLTQNHMRVRKFWLNGTEYEVSQDGSISSGGQPADPLEQPHFIELIKTALLCNDASASLPAPAHQSANSGGSQPSQLPAPAHSREPLETALCEFGLLFGYDKKRLESASPRSGEIPFDPKAKHMITMNVKKGKTYFNLKGAPEAVLEMCSSILLNGKEAPLNPARKKEIFLQTEKFAMQGLRVMGFAYKDASASREIDSHYRFAGLIALADPLRPDAASAVQKARDAGIRVVMITGDHRLTAETIAREAGIFREGDEAITGQELESMPQKELSRRIGKATVFARVTSEHKLAIVELLKKRGEIVAMTGDGVNDALALKKADVGVALGSGTEVAKEASDIVILDDNFASLVDAVEEGRHSAMNIRRVIKYLFATNVTEIVFLLSILFSPILFGTYLPLALLPIHILYVNLVTDGLCDVTLATERKRENLMDKPPSYFAGGTLFTPDVVRFMAVSSIFMFSSLSFVYSLYPHSDSQIAHTRTVIFTLLSFSQLWSAMNARTVKNSVLKIGLFSNKYLTAGIAASILVQLLVIYHPYFNETLKTSPLTPYDWVVVLLFSSMLFALFEGIKLLERRGIRVIS